MRNIDKRVGAYRTYNVRVVGATFKASPAEYVKIDMDLLLKWYRKNKRKLHPLILAATFHHKFEKIHPFNDGNGRIGRVIINYQLYRLGFPGIIIRDKEKKPYYRSFEEYRDNKITKTAEKVITLALIEALHKRIAYLKGYKIINLTEYAKNLGKSSSATLNAAKRQTIPAFREKGVWKIGENK